MFYSFLKILVRFTLKIFFKKIYITGLEHIDNNKAQLIASNHPNGFLEPLIMACFFPKPLHFLVRGDVFDNPFLKPVLVATHQIPIFRFRDGFSKLRENTNTMDASIQVLLENKNLLIFAEGGTESIKKLRPLQKGITRIAFQTLEKKPALDLEVLPVGINFTFPSRFNSVVMLKIGKPIQAGHYFMHDESSSKNKQEELIQDIYTEMKKNIIHLEDQHKIHLFEKLALLQRSVKKYSYLPVFLQTDAPLKEEKNLAELLHTISEEKTNRIGEMLIHLESDIKQEKLTLNDLEKHPCDARRLTVLLLGLIPGIAGAVTHFIPFAIAAYFTRAKVKQKEFKASILMVSSLVLGLIYYIICFFVILTFHLPLIYLVIQLLLGFWLRFYYYLWSDTVFIYAGKLEKFRQEGKNILDYLKQNE